MMKKQLFCASLLLAAALPAWAEGSVTNNPNNRPYFGVRLGGEITCPGNFNYNVGGAKFGIDMFKNGGGVDFGVIYNIPVVANFYIEPGVKLFYNSYSADLEGIGVDGADLEDVQSYSIGKFGLRIPVNLGYHFDFTDDLSLAVFTGPELEFGLSGKQHLKENNVKYSESLYGDEGGYNRVDLNWGFGVGLNINRAFYVGLSGDVGLLNMVKDVDNVTFHENRVSLTLGYNF